jgi:predicted RNA binding protein YcfA (HicA-like mRNA interferase family)
MATKKIKINFKMPTPTAAERLHAQQQKNRKAAGLPDPSEYKKKLDSMKKENYEEDDGPMSQEQLDEISAQLKASYVSGAKKQIKQSLPFIKKTDEYRDIAKNFIAKRQKGIAKANEEVEQLDEMPESSMKTRDVHSHLKKAGWELARSKGGHDVYKHPKAKHSIPVPRHNQLKAPLIRGIMRASKVEEQLEKKGRFVSGPVKQPYKSDTIVTAVKESFRIGGMGGRGGGRGNIYMYDRNPGPRDDDESDHVPYVPKTEHQKKLQKALTDLGNKMKQTHPKLREAKDSQEYDYEGDMAKSDLRSIMHNAKELHDMIEDNTNLAEWVQSKITLAEDYISTVTNYMRSEMNEEVKKNEYHIAGKHKFPTKDEHAVTVKHTESGREHVHSGKGKYLSKLIKTRYNINHYFEEVELDEEVKDEYSRKVDKYLKKKHASDDSKKKQPQGADFAAQRRKERLAKSGRMDEEQHSVLYKMKKDDKKIAVAHYKLKDDAHKFLSSVKTKGGNGIVRSKTNEEVELNEKKNLPGLWANIHAKRKRGEPPAKPGDKDYPKTLNIESAAEPTEGEMKGKQGYSRKAQIVMNAAGKGKKSDNPDKFQKDPELSSEIHKT